MVTAELNGCECEPTPTTAIKEGGKCNDKKNEVPLEPAAKANSSKIRFA
jgi:hypothetical protein